jgi:manganese efflux pump family protein
VGIPALVFLAVGLAMDAAAAAASRGLVVPEVRARDAIAVGLYFGGFQAAMPLVGYLVGARFGPLVAAFDHWIAFAILAVLGAKMIREAFATGVDLDTRTTVDRAPAPFGPRIMVPLAVATSIDALAAGLALPLLGAPLLLSLAIIGVTTATLSVLALFAGRRFGGALGTRLDVFGGVVLIALGSKILVEHLTNGT